MYTKDLSYLYADEYLPTSSMDTKEQKKKLSDVVSIDRSIRTRIHRKTTSTLKFRHRSKHILLFRKDILQHTKQCTKHQIEQQQIKLIQQFLDENRREQFQHLENKQMDFENVINSSPIDKDYNHHFERNVSFFDIFDTNNGLQDCP